MGQDERAMVLMIKGAIAELPEDQRRKVQECYEQLQKLVADNGEEGGMALALLGAELAASQ